MLVTIITPPAVEPLTKEAVKVELRIDSSDLDDQVARHIEAARSFFEEETGWAIIHRTLVANLRFFPKASNILLPFPPLVSVTKVTHFPLGVETPLSPALYLTDNSSRQGSLTLVPGQQWPYGEVLYPPHVQIEYVSGFSADGAGVPPDILQCLMGMIAFWDEVPEAVYVPGDSKSSGKASLLPLHTRDILDRYRKERER